jgi:hypothetical protein
MPTNPRQPKNAPKRLPTFLISNYWNYLVALPKNFFFYFWVLLILSGGHTPTGKIIAIITSIIIIPLFQMWNDRIQKNLLGVKICEKTY